MSLAKIDCRAVEPAVVSFDIALSGTVDQSAAVQAAYAVENPLYIPPGAAIRVGQDSIDFTKVHGWGNFTYTGGINDLPSGDIRTNLNIRVGATGAHFKNLKDAFTYLQLRPFYGSGSITIEIMDAALAFASEAVAAASGGTKQPFPGVIPFLPAGRRVQLLGQGLPGGGGGTTLTIDGAGTAGQDLSFLTLDDGNYLQYINGFAIDGDNYSGRTGGVPSVSDGSPADFIAFIVREQSRAVFGPDLYFEELAANSIMALHHGSVRLVGGTTGQHLKSVRSGRDAFVGVRRKQFGRMLYTAGVYVSGNQTETSNGVDMAKNRGAAAHVRERADLQNVVYSIAKLHGGLHHSELRVGRRPAKPNRSLDRNTSGVTHRCVL